MRARLCCLAGLVGLIAAAAGPQPALAQDVNRIVRTLNTILNPGDAQRLEDRARREGREDEERYWRDYRAGLEHRHSEREGAYARPDQIGPDEARRLEEQSRRNRRSEEERYWRNYRAGLAPQNAEPGIRADEARRFEEQSRRNHRLDEERYWREYRAGLETRDRDRGDYRDRDRRQ